MEVRSWMSAYKDCWLEVKRYMHDQSLAIEVWNMDEGPITGLTVCIDGYCKPRPDESYVDVNNFPEALDFIAQYGLGKDTGIRQRSGYVMYPLVRWNIETLKKYAKGDWPDV